MKGRLQVILWFVIKSALANQLKVCNDENWSTDFANICKISKNYSSLDFPEPIPCIIKPELRIQEIIDINEEKQVVSLIGKVRYQLDTI